MPKYKKRKDGRYATSITVGYDNNGKRIQKTVYGKTIRELDDKLADIKSQLNKGIVVDDKGLTFGEWAQTWYKTYKEGTIKYNRSKTYMSAFKKFEPLNDIRLKNIKRHDIQQILNRCTPSTAIYLKQIITNIINAAIDEQYIHVDVTRGLVVPKYKSAEKRALTDDEINRIMSAALSPEEKALTLLLLTCGLRRGEAAALTWDDIDLDKKMIHISKGVVYHSNKPILSDMPKTVKSIRDVPIVPILADTLSVLPRDKNIIFGGESYYTESQFTTIWAHISAACDFPRDVTPHVLRHTYATKLYHAGVDPKTAQQLLGHARVEMTLDIYTHCAGLEAQTIDKIADVFDF